MTAQSVTAQPKGFKRFFLRGLGIILPTILTIWLVVVVYNFVDERIAAPLNEGVKMLVPQITPWTGEDVDSFWKSSEVFGSEKAPGWPVMDLTGLLIAALLIWVLGRVVGGFLGRRVVHQGERLLLRVPIFKQIYPHVKQVTDLFFSEPDDRIRFSRVIAVQYPRKGIWSVGLVTGDTMVRIQDAAGQECMTVFIPSSPTPFTGYTITVPRSDTVDLPISIDEAFRFCVSGGVIVPQSQVVEASPESDSGAGALPADASGDVSEEREPSASIESEHVRGGAASATPPKAASGAATHPTP